MYENNQPSAPQRITNLSQHQFQNEGVPSQNQHFSIIPLDKATSANTQRDNDNDQSLGNLLGSFCASYWTERFACQML
jgi:hypothetical protein